MGSTTGTASVWPVEAKVKAASAGGLVGVAVGEALVWVLDQYVWTPGVLGDLPAPIGALVTALAAAGAAWAAGYRAPHTPRPPDGSPAADGVVA